MRIEDMMEREVQKRSILSQGNNDSFRPFRPHQQYYTSILQTVFHELS